MPNAFRIVLHSRSINSPPVTVIRKPLDELSSVPVDLSFNVTRNVTGVATLPWESCAVHVTAVVAVGNSLPELGVQIATLVPSTISKVAGDEYKTTSPDALSVLSIISV